MVLQRKLRPSNVRVNVQLDPRYHYATPPRVCLVFQVKQDVVEKLTMLRDLSLIHI